MDGPTLKIKNFVIIKSMPTDLSKLLFKIDNLAFTSLSPLLGSFQVTFNHSKLSGNLTIEYTKI